MKVMVIGGSGVFGSRLVTLLQRNPKVDVMSVGRAQFDRNNPSLQKLNSIAPSVVVDAAGPWQNFDHRLVTTCIRAGCHYIDLSDDAAFTHSIAQLDALAREANVSAISGASTVPAISASVCHSVLHSVGSHVDVIESVVLPGNRAPRGLSVMSAILAQVGQRNAWDRILHPLGTDFADRWMSPIGAPDLALFPEHFAAREVRFFAGLELRLLHGGLYLLHFLPRWGLVDSLRPFARPLRTIASWFTPFGSDTGGMVVQVTGDQAQARWTLKIFGGDGPSVPTVAAAILVDKLAEQQEEEGTARVPPGARACLTDVTLDEVNDKLSLLNCTTKTQILPAVQPLFRGALGDDVYSALPSEVQRLHNVIGSTQRWKGRATVTGSDSVLARLIRWIHGFPGPSPLEGVRAQITISRLAETETWRRTIDGSTFVSHLRPTGRSGELEERFGALRFILKLRGDSKQLHFSVSGINVFGMRIALPRFLLSSEAIESQSAAEGHFQYDVPIRVAGMTVVHYRGKFQKD